MIEREWAVNAEQEFDRRIAAIHGLGDSRVHTKGVQEIDVRRAEFEALADVFLGEVYDPLKRKQLEDLQIALHQQQAALHARWQDGELSDQAYLDSANAQIDELLKNCEEVL